jgi:protein-disulfide isomerase/uncharacterized membrane protein
MNGMTGVNFIFILNAVAMIAVSIYLTNHFYETLYPTKLGGTGSLCNLSNFFNCDAATYSKLSNLAGIPISFFGLMIGVLFLFTSLLPSEALEKTASAISKYNFIGCILLFIFSLGALGSLCPFCTVYYLFSAVAFVLLYKFGMNSWSLKFTMTEHWGLFKMWGVFEVWGLALIIGSVLMGKHTAEKELQFSKLNTSIVEQFRKLPSLGDPTQESAYKIHMSTANFSQAPIRITVFSDFECPFCKVVAEQMPELIRRYSNQINIQYLFYPLDAKCNSNVKSRFHEHACDAAYLAACDEKKFAEVHDEIFAQQEKLKSGVLMEIAKSHDLESCLNNEEVKNKVVVAINAASQFNLKSTPTIIINGKKIEGTIPSGQFFAIFEDILAEKK